MPSALLRFASRRPRIIASLNVIVPVLVLLVGYRWYSVGNTIWVPAHAPRLVRSGISIAPGIYLLGAMSPAAVYVIETSKGLVLVDSGLESEVNVLKWEMTRLGLDWKRVCAVLLTHAHGDHSGGAEALRAATGATVYAGDGDVPVLRAGMPREAFFSTFFMPSHDPHPTTVDVALTGGERLEIGGVSIEALAMPGHTPGSICYLLERENLRALFTGDVIIMLRGDEQPRTELRKPLGTYSAYLAPRYRGDAKDSLASLRRLRALPVPSLVLPGHPAADDTPQNPCLTQERWESLLDQGIHDMETLLARYQADGPDFLDGVPKQILPDMYYFGDFRGSAVYGFFASSKFFIVDAPGGTGFVEFLNRRLRQLGRDPQPATAVLLTACGMNETAALKEVVEKSHAQVVAPIAGIQKLKESCAPETVFLSTDELPAKGWFPVTSTPLEGPGIAPVAYQIAWAGKNVLYSGRIPSKVTRKAGELISELFNSTDKVPGYFASLRQLMRMKPDLWLPATSTDEHNANLYDRDWERVIEDNLSVVKLIVSH